jgi:hypothetical protein
MYHNGDGVEKNDQRAAQWFQQAAGQGHAYAQFHLGNMYYDGDGVERDYRRIRIAWS